jgi:hypothetical protein
MWSSTCDMTMYLLFICRCCCKIITCCHEEWNYHFLRPMFLLVESGRPWYAHVDITMYLWFICHCCCKIITCCHEEWNYHFLRPMFLLVESGRPWYAHVEDTVLDRNLICTPIRFRETKSDYETSKCDTLRINFFNLSISK